MRTFIRFYRWLSINHLLRKQVRELHEEVRTLRAENEARNRVLIDTNERLYEAHELLLEHNLYCVPSWGNSR